MEQVNALHLHNNRIETLIDQLYGINRRLMTLEGQLVKTGRPSPCRTAASSSTSIAVPSLIPDWIDRVAKLPGKGWSGS